MHNKIFSYEGIRAAKRLLSSPADGSIANQQARERALSYLNRWTDNLQRFADLRGGLASDRLKNTIKDLREFIAGVK